MSESPEDGAVRPSAEDRIAALQRRVEELEGQRRHLDALFDVLPFGVWIADRTGRLVERSETGEAASRRREEGVVTYWNPAAEAIYGWSSEEATGRSFAELDVPPETRGEAAGILEVVERDGSWSGPFTLRRKDGSTFPGHLSLTALRGLDGDTYGFVGITTDLTDQARMVEERDELIAALEMERARLEGIFREAPAFIAVLRGPDHVFEMANPWFYQALGEEREELIGLPARDALPEMAAQGFLDLLDRVRETGEPYVGREERVLLHIDPSAEPREVFCNFVFQPVKGPDGAVARIVVHGVDVTDLVRSRQEAERASRAKSDFLAVISHELRTPLNAILGYVDLMDLGVPVDVPDEVARYLGRIRLSASHLRQLIDDILTIGRLEAGREGVELEVIPLGEVVQEVRAIMEPAMRAKGLDFEVDAEGLPAEIVSDPRKLRQILVNLVGNAAKFTEEGSVRVILRGVGAEPERYFQVRVEDTGVGIAPADREKLFEPFWQADRERTRSEGAGLGLAITRRLAHMLGGRVEVQSRPGQGSVFTVDLPLIHGVDPPGSKGGSGTHGRRARL